MKIFLVEDEPIALQALQRKICDCCPDCQIIGTAENGAEALEKLNTLHPDILFTDIRMPVMDGLTLLRKMNDRKLHLISIILSGYEDFNYAQQALHLGAEEYLLKPLDPDDLKECLDVCREKLSRRKDAQNVDILFKNNSPYRLSRLGENETLTILYLVCGNPLQRIESVTHPDIVLPPLADFEEFFRKYLPDDLLDSFNGIFSNEKLFLCRFRPQLTEERLQELCEILAEKLGIYLTMQYMPNISQNNLTRSLRSCRKLMVDHVILGKTQVCGPSFTSVTADAGSFAEIMQKKGPALLRSSLEQIFSRWQTDCVSLVEVQNMLTFFLQSVLPLSDTSVTNSDLVYFVENTICFSRNYSQLTENFYQLIGELVVVRPSADEIIFTHQELVKKIEVYFTAHLSDAIAIQDITDTFGISKVSLIRIFKEVKKTTPIVYFNEMKIERAKQLLLQYPDMPLYQIAEQLGFNDVCYFSKTFKKYVGISPTFFRE